MTEQLISPSSPEVIFSVELMELTEFPRTTVVIKFAGQPTGKQLLAFTWMVSKAHAKFTFPAQPGKSVAHG